MHAHGGRTGAHRHIGYLVARDGIDIGHGARSGFDDDGAYPGVDTGCGGVVVQVVNSKRDFYREGHGFAIVVERGNQICAGRAVVLILTFGERGGVEQLAIVIDIVAFQLCCALTGRDIADIVESLQRRRAADSGAECKVFASFGQLIGISFLHHSLTVCAYRHKIGSVSAGGGIKHHPFGIECEEGELIEVDGLSATVQLR